MGPVKHRRNIPKALKLTEAENEAYTRAAEREKLNFSDWVRDKLTQAAKSETCPECGAPMEPAT